MTDRYQWLTELVAEWRPRPIEPGDGFTEQEIRQAEERLGVPFPVALRKWYLLAGKRKDITSRHNGQISPDRLRVKNGMLYIWAENQAVHYYAILVADLGEDDPPVWFIVPDTPEHNFECSYVTQFLSCMVAFELFMGNEYAAWGGVEENEAIVRNMEPVGELDAEWLSIRIYRGSETLAMVWPYDPIVIGRTPEAVDRMVIALGGGFWINERPVKDDN